MTNQDVLSIMTDKIVRCKDCVHRDPEDKKCDCGALERAGCIFPVADDYFCAHGKEAHQELPPVGC